MQLSYCLLLHVARRLMQAYTHPSSTPVTTAHVWQGRGGVKSQSPGCNLWKWCCAPEWRSLTVSCPLLPVPFTCQGGWITPSHVARLKLNGGRTASQVQSSQMVIPGQHSFQHRDSSLLQWKSFFNSFYFCLCRYKYTRLCTDVHESAGACTCQILEWS